MVDPGRQTPRSPQRSKVMRSQKIQPLASPAEDEVATFDDKSSSSRRRERSERDRAGSTASSSSTVPVPPIRSHTPGHLSTKSQDRRRKPAELSIRQRSQSSSSLSAAAVAAAAAASSSASGVPSSTGESPTTSHLTVSNPKTPGRSAGGTLTTSMSTPSAVRSPYRGGGVSNNTTTSDLGGSGSGSDSPAQGAGGAPRRPTAMRSTSAIASKPSVYGNVAGGVPSNTPRSGGGSSSRGTPKITNGSGRGGGGGGYGNADKNGQPPGYTAFPPLADPNTAPDVLPAPSSGMYWTRAPVSGVPHPTLRAHTATLIGSNIFIFGGCDARACFSDLYVFDADSFHWTKPHVVGEIPLPLRAMTCTAVGKKLVVFGGGDGPLYYNDVYVLDTTNFRWSRPRISSERPVPSKRRAHTACLYKNGIYVFGGGDGIRALNDVWRLDVTDTNKMSWKQISGVPQPPSPDIDGHGSSGKGDEDNVTPGGSSTRGATGLGVTGAGLESRSGSVSAGSTTSTLKNGSSNPTPSASSATLFSSREDPATAAFLNQPHLLNQARPKARGYHTANIVGTKLIIFGGSDGGECFNDVWVYDVETHLWRSVAIPVTHRRLSHTATIVGSYLFVIGGHDGAEYSNEVLLLNLVTMSWDRRKVYGLPPSGRGYHSTVLYDSRLLMIGGFDGNEVFDEVWTLELAVHAYYSQISHFTIEV
ncbi:hypothetical protein SEUCBS139899_006145 [Sporothrix eucalyptigena]|uniref:Kelch repeat protein n=1 Tax=Sporothrix eucalyptigena TaxID=1812306 RepID=A0ABP0AQS9_9PEZI